MRDKKLDRDQLADLIERAESDPKLYAALHGLTASVGIEIPLSAEWDLSASVRKAWIVEMILKIFKDRQRVQTNEDDTEALNGWYEDLLLLCSEIDRSGASVSSVSSSKLRSFFLSALEVGFVFGTVAEDRVEFRRAMQSRGGRASGKKRGEGKWKDIATRLAISISADGVLRSADALATAVIMAWDVRTPKHPTARTMAPYMKLLASKPNSTIKLKIDGRAKNLRK